MRLIRPYLRIIRMPQIVGAAAFVLAAVFFFAPPALSDWVSNGDAYFSGGDIVITPESGNQVGSAWLNSRIDLSYDFDITLFVNLGNNDGGADGLSVAFHDDPGGTAALGDTAGGGEWIGMHTIWPAVSVELDTYQNAGRGDPPDDHIAVNEFGDAADGPGHAGAAPVALGDIEDGADHPLRLVWDSASRTLTIYFDGISRITYTRDFIANIFGGNTRLWFGVVGSTGGAYNLQRFRPLIVNDALSVAKSVAPSAVDAGDSVTYTVTIRNNGAIAATLTDIEDQLPAGFTYQTGTSTGLTAGDPAVAAQTLTWSGAWIVAPGQTRTLAFQADSATAPGVYDNTVTLRGSDFEDLSTGPTAAVSVAVSDLSTSTKTVVDINGGDPLPGDILRYTITLNETAGRTADAASVTDEIPADVTAFSMISIPPGAVDASTGAGTGANGTGRLQVDDIAVPANGSAAVVFEVAIAPGTPLGTAIDNTAAIVNPSGNGASPSAPTVVVADSSLPAAGNKALYFFSETANHLSRRQPTAAEPEVQIDGDNDQVTWNLTPALASTLTISGDTGVIPVELFMRRNPAGQSRELTVTLSTSSTIIGTVGPETRPISSGNPGIETFNIPVAGDITLPPGEVLRLTIRNTTSKQNRSVFIDPEYNGAWSRIYLESETVINVDQVTFHDAAYPGGSLIPTATPGQIVFIRATVSDPFGSFDITGAAMRLVDPAGNTVVPGMVMGEVYDSGAATKIYEVAATIPPAGPEGIWTARVTAEEGSEAEVRHTGIGTLLVAAPDIVLLKTVSVVSDPVNGGAHPKAIPGALMQYTIIATNQGGGAADPDSVVLTDPVPADTSLFVGDLGAANNGPVAFIDGGTPSGLSYTFGGLGDGTDDIEFSNDGGSGWTYTPVPDGNGVDAAVTHVRINPKGEFNGTAGGGIPSFTLRLRVRVR